MPTALAIAISLLSPIVAIVGLVVAAARVRTRASDEVQRQIQEGDRRLDERIQKQEVLCSGTRGEVLTKLDGLEKSQSRLEESQSAQMKKLDQILTIARNGGGRSHVES